VAGIRIWFERSVLGCGNEKIPCCTVNRPQLHEIEALKSEICYVHDEEAEENFRISEDPTSTVEIQMGQPYWQPAA